VSSVAGRPWLQTYRGNAWCADEPETYSYDIVEIAHALSNLCRFAGHVRELYSVAQHSVLVAEEVHAIDPTITQAALLHDAAEAYVIDMPAPLKRMPELTGYRNLIARVEVAIADHFGFARHLGDPTIKRADLVLLATEKRDVMGSGPHDSEWQWLPPARREPITPWSPTSARERFLAAWCACGGIR
jgi:hypothetical protein